MDPSRVLVLYYTRTGATRAVAEAIRSECRCDIEQILDRTRRTGVLGFVRSMVDAVLGRPAELLPMRSHLGDYDLVIIGGPVWLGSIATPIRTLLHRHSHQLAKVAFFCTYLGTGSVRALREMSVHSGKVPAVTLDVRTRDARSFSLPPKIRALSAALGIHVCRERKSRMSEQGVHAPGGDEALVQ